MGAPAAAPAAAAAEGVVVESGPVVYDDVAADEEEEDEDEPCVSAMDLFGSSGEFKHILRSFFFQNDTPKLKAWPRPHSVRLRDVFGTTGNLPPSSFF